MFRKLLIGLGTLFLSVFLSGCSFKKAPAALQINTNPPANVFIDGKILGKTPFQSSEMQPGEITVKLIPESTEEPLSSWENKISLNSGVLTLIERELASTEAESSGQILTLEKSKDKEKASLTVISDPDGALIHIDGEAKGFTPITIDQIGVGDHQIVLSKEGYLEKSIRARAVSGFKLVVNAKMGQEAATGSSAASASGTPTPSAKPTGTSKSSGTTFTVEIKETSTGWLRVRKEASTASAEVGKVNPGEKYEVLEEKNGWYKIEYESDSEGWISGQYTSKL
ncbi:PEGA domain-containing protein [Patescibacteria group bacterium]|nr:PEGA domain-containing protein [Patescibacteria group bacterium]